MILIDGAAIAGEIQAEIQQTIEKLSGRPPCLAVILVGNNPASEIYVRRKRQACLQVGIRSIFCALPDLVTEEELLRQVDAYNNDPEIDGILVQLPLPAHIHPLLVTRRIDPKKDVDGFHPVNMGKLLIGETDGFVPCTPLGIKVMMERMGIQVAGKRVVVVGRSNIVGKPIAALLMQNAPGSNATVTVVHSRSSHIRDICSEADILIAAIGQPLWIKEEMVKEGAVVIDVGINKIANPAKASGFQLVGDVDFENVKNKCSFISPVPGGVGPLTIAMLLQNTLNSYLRRHES